MVPLLVIVPTRVVAVLFTTRKFPVLVRFCSVLFSPRITPAPVVVSVPPLITALAPRITVEAWPKPSSPSASITAPEPLLV